MAPNTNDGLGELGGNKTRSGSDERKGTQTAFNKTIPAEGPQVTHGNYKGNDGQMTLDIVSQETRGGFGNKFTCYKIVGHDSNGPIEVYRRFSEFYLFHEKLTTRYPGLFIPPVPPKKAQGKLEEDLVNERMYFLQTYLLALCSYPILCKTIEVQMFFRPQAKTVEDSFKALPN